MKNENLSKMYKNRVTDFLEKMTELPIKETDFYKPKSVKYLGPAFMRFTAPKGDDDIMKSYKDQSVILDPTPSLPERVTWNMRPRNKNLELGPEFKFTHRLQMQRVSDRLNSETWNSFKQSEITTPQY